LKPAYTRALLALSLIVTLLTLAGGASAKPPTLEPASDFPGTVLPNHQYTFQLIYKQPEGDPPAKMQMIVDAPYGQVTQSGHIPAGDPAAGVPLDWSFTPQQSGQYQYHFEVTSATGGVARFPAGAGGLEMDSPNPVIKYLVLAVGLVIALFFLPFLVYLLARSANKRSDPAAAARIALLIGILSFCGLAWYLFLYDNQDVASRTLGFIIEVLAVGAFLVVMLNRRRAA
jgi:quinol-cytochrome oxidoreductase complex cytochrome b subunit